MLSLLKFLLQMRPLNSSIYSPKEILKNKFKVYTFILTVTASTTEESKFEHSEHLSITYVHIYKY